MKNAAVTLTQCIDSCLQQTHQDFKLLIIDDHSTDSSLSLAKTLTENLSPERIQIVTNTGSGLVDALNMGLSLTDSPWIARMDADDIMDSDRLSMQHAFLTQHPVIDVVGTQVASFPTELLQQGFNHFIQWQNSLINTEDLHHAIFIETPLTHPSVMFKRDAVITAGGYLSGDFPEDYELWLRLNAQGLRFAKIERVLLHWRESTNRLSRTAHNCRREAFDVLRARYLAKYLKTLEARPLYVWGAGRATRKRAALLMNHGIKIERWVDIDPKKIGNNIRGVPVISPHALSDAQIKPFILVYVNNRGAREEINAALDCLDFRSGKDRLCVG